MKSFILTGIFILLAVDIFSQNLVRNPGFEEYINCPYTDTSIVFPPGTSPGTPEHSLTGWYRVLENHPLASLSPFLNTKPEYFNMCNVEEDECIKLIPSPQNPFGPPLIFARYGVPVNHNRFLDVDSGRAYIGMSLWTGSSRPSPVEAGVFSQRKDFIANKLQTPLEPGQYYQLSFYIVKGRSNQYCNIFYQAKSIDRVGVLFSNGFITTDNINDITIPAVQPQLETPAGSFITDSNNWVRVSFNFFANDTNQIMTVGNFQKISDYEAMLDRSFEAIQKAYYFFDNFSLRKYNDDIFEGYNPTRKFGVCDYDTLFLDCYDCDGQIWSNGDTSDYISYADLNFIDDTATVWVKSFRNQKLFIDTFVVWNNDYGSIRDIDTVICANDSTAVSLDVLGDNLVFYDLDYNKLKNAPIVSNAEEGQYQYYYKHRDTCSIEYGLINLRVILAPDIELLDTVFRCTGDSARLEISSDWGNALWSTGDTTNSIIVNESGWYGVSVSSECGIFTDSSYVLFEKCEQCLMLPDAFSPNGDGLNDKFKIVNRCPEINSFEIQIYDRWSNLVFRSYNHNIGWDGTVNGVPGDIGVYFYILRYRGNITGDYGYIKGEVHLIR